MAAAALSLHRTPTTPSSPSSRDRGFRSKGRSKGWVPIKRCGGTLGGSDLTRKRIALEQAVDANVLPLDLDCDWGTFLRMSTVLRALAHPAARGIPPFRATSFSPRVVDDG